VGSDVGISLNPINNSKLGNVLLGFALQNWMQPVIGNTDPNIDPDKKTNYGFQVPSFFGKGLDPKDGYAIPSNLNMSLFYRSPNRVVELKGEASLIDIFPEPTESTEEGGNKGRLLATSFSGTYFVTPHVGAKVRFTKEGYPVIGATVNVKDVSLFR
jgi:hypothetical protein